MKCFIKIWCILFIYILTHHNTVCSKIFSRFGIFIKHLTQANNTSQYFTKLWFLVLSFLLCFVTNVMFYFLFLRFTSQNSLCRISPPWIIHLKKKIDKIIRPKTIWKTFQNSINDTHTQSNGTLFPELNCPEIKKTHLDRFSLLLWFGKHRRNLLKTG